MAGILLYTHSPDLPDHLAWFNSDAAPEAFPTPEGPDGQPGWVHLRYQPRRESNPRVLGYCPLTQCWHKSPVKDHAHWIGWDVDRPPTPADLERPNVGRCVPVRLGDGQVWKVPVARAAQRLTLGEDGTWARETDVDAAGYVDRAARIFDIFTRQLLAGIREASGEVNGYGARQVLVELPDDEAIAHAVEALTRAYVLDDAVISLLGLLSDEAVVAVCQASVEIPLFGEIASEKKTPPQQNSWVNSGSGRCPRL